MGAKLADPQPIILINYEQAFFSVGFFCVLWSAKENV